MLGAHPAIATPQETELFSRYVAPLAEAWEWQLRGGPDAWRARRFKGLPGVLTTEQFTDVVHGVIGAALDGVAKLAPDATAIVEKSPSHSTCANLLAQYASDARIIHLVRDGRDVAASLLAAGEGWGSEWAPKDLKRAARSWVRHVEGAEQYRKLGFVYRELRYEALAAGDATTLRTAFELCGVDVDDAECARRYEAHRLDAMAGETPPEDPIVIGGEFATLASEERREPAGFFGAGGSGAWREAWGADERLLFCSVAGRTLERLGYEPNGRWAAGPARAAAWRASVTARRVLAGGARRVGRLGERAARSIP
jgi:hypothetical protein